jgi:hypothetical protein
VYIATVMVSNDAGQPVLGRMPMREAVTYLGEEERRGHDEDQQKPGEASHVRGLHGLQDNRDGRGAMNAGETARV